MFRSERKQPDQRVAAGSGPQDPRRFIRTDIDSSPRNAAGIRPHAHSVFTEDYSDTPGHPTRVAFDNVIAFLRRNL